MPELCVCLFLSLSVWSQSLVETRGDTRLRTVRTFPAGGRDCLGTCMSGLHLHFKITSLLHICNLTSMSPALLCISAKRNLFLLLLANFDNNYIEGFRRRALGGVCSNKETGNEKDKHPLLASFDHHKSCDLLRQTHLDSQTLRQRKSLLRSANHGFAICEHG